MSMGFFCFSVSLRPDKLAGCRPSLLPLREAAESRHLALFFGGGLTQSRPEKRDVFAAYKPIHFSLLPWGC